MPSPKISITKHTTGLYGWQTSYNQVVIAGETGDQSIEACLKRAIEGMPASEDLVEVCYRGIHMGAFSAEQMRKFPDEIVDHINETYDVLVESRV